MAKRSKRHHKQQNKDQAGCMWGLISIFDFRHVRTTKRLLSDRRLEIKDNVASENPPSEVNLLTSSEETHVAIEDIEEIKNPSLDVVKTSVKELMEEEMISEQDPTKQTEKPSNVSFNDLEALMKEILILYQTRHNDLNEGQNRNFTIVEEKLTAAIELFMNENSTEDQEKTERSKDLIDTFQMITSNKELFMKLLQDQNPILLNEDQKSKSKSTQRSNSLENEPSNRKHRNFFRRRSKSVDVDNSTLSSSRIVILKPNSLENRIKLDNNNNDNNNNVYSERINSQFSFMEIKKRLKHVIGKEQSRPGSSERNIEAINGWSSPNRDHFYTEKFTKKVVEKRVSNLGENGDVSSHISSIYLEAKKHLLEMVSNGYDDAELMMERLPRTLGKILSCPEVNEKSQPCVDSSNLDENLKVHDEVDLDNNTLVEGVTCSIMEDTSREEAIEIGKQENQEEMEVMDVLYGECSSPERLDDEQHDENVEVFDEKRSPECLKSDSLEEIEFSSPIGSSLSNNIEEVDSNSIDKSGRPSPVSVLEPLFSDNEISPTSTISRPVAAGIQPLCIRFEDHETCRRTCLENEESEFEYVEAVLLASDLNWDEFEKRWLSSLQILDSSLFHEVEIFSNRPSHDQKLLFDSTNEILQEVCDCYLHFFLQLSFIKRKIQPVPEGADLINEIWEKIELNLKGNYPLSLDRLVKKDFGSSRTWMDLRADSREIVFEIDESIFEDVLEDTLLCLIEDFVDDEC
ncbi:hypothetical protein LXL04_022647 [Taraxacum kok-saghyz]